MRRYFLAICLAAVACEYHAQPSLFEGLDMGVRGPVLCMLEDTASGSLYVAGGMIGATGGMLSPGIVRWDGQDFYTVGCGFEYDCVDTVTSAVLATPVQTLEFWEGDLYAGGSFEYAIGVPVNFVSHWDGVAWQPLQSGLSGPVYSLRAYTDGLYAAGWFEFANDTLAVNGIARWDGSTWHKVHDLPRLNPLDINRINDVAQYQGEIYIGGNFSGTNGRRDIAKWNGTEWVDVDGGFLGVFSSVNKLEVHDGLLYVAGSFANYPPNGHPDNPGSGILTYDGTNWGDLDGGTAGSSNASVIDMEWIRDTLHVVGRFHYIGGVLTGRVAKWDGEHWCSLVPFDYFYPDIVAIGSYRDTLYVGGSFVVAGPDSINRVAKWVAGNYVDSCSFDVGIAEPPGLTDVLLFPNPATDHVMLGTLPSAARYASFHDALGRVVLVERIPSDGRIGLSAIASGHYEVVLLAEDGHPTARGRLSVQRE